MFIRVRNDNKNEVFIDFKIPGANHGGQAAAKTRAIFQVNLETTKKYWLKQNIPFDTQEHLEKLVQSTLFSINGLRAGDSIINGTITPDPGITLTI